MNVGKIIQFCASIIAAFAFLIVLIIAIPYFNNGLRTEGCLIVIGGLLGCFLLFLIIYAIGQLVSNSHDKRLIMLADYYARNGDKAKADWFLSQINEE